MLAPGLELGAVVVMDNLPAYKQFFGKSKALLRKAAARTAEALWTTIGNLLDQCSPIKCVNYLANCGYEPT